MEREIIFTTMSLEEGQLVETNVRMIKQSDIGQCPFVIMVPTHYRDDGSCKCDDIAEQEMMIREWDYTPQDFLEVGIG